MAIDCFFGHQLSDLFHIRAKKSKAFAASADNPYSYFIYRRKRSLKTEGNTVGTEDAACEDKLAPQPTRVSVRARIADGLLTPALAPIMHHRWWLLVLAGLAILQLALTAAGLRGWQCPIHVVFGLPCPGCGLSKAMALFIQGKWHAAIYTHAFAPIILAAIILLATAALMPRRIRANLSLRVAALERRTGIVAFLVLIMFIYWGLRLCGVFGSITWL